MKKILYFLIISTLLLINAQFCFSKMLLNFKAIDITKNIKIKPDSIVIRDLTKGQQKTITDTSYDIDLLFTGIIEDESAVTQSLLNTCFPNPFDNTTNLQIYLSEPSNVTFSLFDILGNIVFTKSENTREGYHSYILNINGLEPGSYFLKVSDKINQSYLKIIKMGVRTGTVITLVNNGSDNNLFIKNEKEHFVGILLVNTDIYSFTCYAKGYQAVKIDSVDMSKKKSDDTLTFLLQPLNKYNIHSGYIDVSGINCKYFWSSSDWQGRSGDKSSDTATHYNPYNFNSNLQNLSLPDSVASFASICGDFLPCPAITNEDLYMNFCSKVFSHTYSSGIMNCISNTTMVNLFFNINNAIIDSIKFNLYYYNSYTNTNSSGQEIRDRIYNNLYIYNLPYSKDSLNNIVIDIKGKNITDFLKIGYNKYKNKSGNFGAGSGLGHENENFISIESVDDNAYIKLILRQ